MIFCSSDILTNLQLICSPKVNCSSLIFITIMSDWLYRCTKWTCSLIEPVFCLYPFRLSNISSFTVLWNFIVKSGIIPYLYLSPSGQHVTSQLFLSVDSLWRHSSFSHRTAFDVRSISLSKQSVTSQLFFSADMYLWRHNSLSGQPLTMQVMTCDVKNSFF